MREWLAELDAGNAGAPAVVMRNAAEFAPELAAGLDADREDRTGLRWDVACWFVDLAGLGSQVAPLLQGVAIPTSHVRVAAIVARRAGPRGAPLAIHLARTLATKGTAQAEILAALGAIGPAAPLGTHETLRAGLAATDPAVRVRAARGCRAVGADAQTTTAAIVALREALRARDAGTRAEAARALGEFGADAATAVPDLIEALANQRAAWYAREALGVIGRAEPGTAELLRRALAGRTGLLACVALWGVVGPTPEVVAFLEAELAAGGSRAENTLWLAPRLGPEAASLLPALEGLLTSAKPTVAIRAALACCAIGGPTPARLAPLRAQFTPARKAWMLPIYELEARPKSAVWLLPELRLVLPGVDPGTQARICALLVRSGADVDGGLAMLETALRRPASSDRLRAVDAARTCGPLARPLLDLLIAYRDGDGAFWSLSHDAVDAVEGRTPGR